MAGRRHHRASRALAAPMKTALAFFLGAFLATVAPIVGALIGAWLHERATGERYRLDEL